MLFRGSRLNRSHRPEKQCDCGTSIIRNHGVVFYIWSSMHCVYVCLWEQVEPSIQGGVEEGTAGTGHDHAK